MTGGYTFLAVMVTALATCGVVVTLVGAGVAERNFCRQRQRDYDEHLRKADAPVVLDVSEVPPGTSAVVVTYAGFLTPPQREQVQKRVKQCLGEEVRVLVMEGGLTVAMQKGNVDL